MPLRRVGVQLAPEHCDLSDLRSAWRRADRLGVDSIWLWDHFFPINGPPEGPHFEGMSLLAAMAVETQRASIGLLVTAVTYRNTDLLADMVRTIDCLSGGRTVLGIGASWSVRDHGEYGIPFGPLEARAQALETGIQRVKCRLARLNPPAIGRVPVLVGGGSERVLRIAARYADMWNGRSPVLEYGHRNRLLDEHCAAEGRHPGSLERTAQVPAHDVDNVDKWVGAGATHVILRSAAPFDFGGLWNLLEYRDRA